MNQNPQNNKHLLTVLVEDYFHVGAFESLIREQNWSRFDPRYEQNTLKALDLLDEYDKKATFFVLGWIAEQNPNLIKEIVSRGHEVASRGFYHRSLRQLTPDEFREDIRKTNRALENASGQKVIGYRAAEKLNYEKDSWVLDILAEEGIAYDASFLPSKKDVRSKRFAHQHHSAGKAIWEFPYATRNLGLGLLPISGGNYFRQFPYTLMRRAVSDWVERYEKPFVFYFHVWELDPEQPRISAASNYNRIRHYRKLDKMEWIVRENLKLYDFCDVAEFLDLRDSLGVEGHTPKAKVQIAEIETPKRTAPLIDISVVIPCYNEVDSLDYLSNTLRSVESNLNNIGYAPSFIFIDDKSTDETFEKLHQLFGETANVKILQHEQNKGVAGGIMTGIRAAETEIVCSMDCDCTYDPHQLVEMVPMLTDGVDMVTASQYHKKGEVRNVPKWRLVFSKGASFCYRRVLQTKLATYTSCFRVYRRSAMVDLNVQDGGFLGVTEMLGRLDLKGGNIVECPAVLETRLFGASKMNTLRTTFEHLGLLYRLSKERFLKKGYSSSAVASNEIPQGTADQMVEK
jgi:polysaccharide deacetylase family protein (PEP-CTERM system associated)